MDLNDYYTLGYISKTSGTDSRLVIQADTDSADRYKKLESFMVDLYGTLTPFFVKAVRVQLPSTLVILAEDVDAGMAEQLIGKEVYVPLTFLPKLSGKKFYFHEVIGFEVIDSEKGSIGTVIGIYDRAKQAIFQVMKEKTEIMIPVVDEFISKIDRENKRIEMNLPEGLIDIYLGSSEEEDPYA